MPAIFAIDGPCGSGNTFAIESLMAVSHGFAFVDPDVVKERTFSYRFNDVSDWLGIAKIHGESWRRRVAVDVVLFWLQRLAELQRPVCMELCRTMQLYERINEIAEPCGYDMTKVLSDASAGKMPPGQ